MHEAGRLQNAKVRQKSNSHPKEQLLALGLIGLTRCARVLRAR